MRRPLLVLAFVLLPPVTGSLRAQAAPDLRLVRFADYLEALRTQARIPGLVAAIIGPQRIVWEASFGRQDLERAIPTRTDTLFHLNGLTEIVTASLVLRCAEEGRLSLDDPVTADPALTPRQILTHTTGPPGAQVFSYAPGRLDALAPALEACTGRSFRTSVAGLLERLAMFDSVPGADVVELKAEDVAGADDPPDEADLERYAHVLERLATSYAVGPRGRATPVPDAGMPLAPADGLISTVLDYAHFDLALKQGILLLPDTLTEAWRAPVGADGEPLPHGLGWFVQPYGGEIVAWQFGVRDNASSSLVVMVPSRGLTLILLANASGLAKDFALSEGDLTTSPFGRLFLELFVG